MDTISTSRLGVAFISLHTVASEPADGRLVVLDVAGLPVMRQWYAVRGLDKELLAPAQAMLDFLGEDGFRYLPSAQVTHSERPTKISSQ